MSGTVLVTGATGSVGREVVRALRRRGISVRAGVRDVARAREQLGAVHDVVRLDLADSSTWVAAADGCAGVFLIRPPGAGARLTTFVDAARGVDADHFVYLSALGARRTGTHRRIEEHLEGTSAPFAILRPAFLAQDLQGAYRRDIVEDGRLYVPAGDGRVAFVDAADVAEAAADVFARPELHERAAHTLTGPEALGFADVAALLTDALGRPIRYEAASGPGYLAHLRRRGMPWGAAIAHVFRQTAVQGGRHAVVDPTLATLLGRPGRTVADYVRDNADAWRTK